MSFLLQKSFRLVDGQLVTLGGHPITSINADCSLSRGQGFAATISANYWVSVLASDALCSFASEPGVRAVIAADELLSRKGVVVRVPSYSIVALSSDYPVENAELEALFPNLDIEATPEELRENRSIMSKRQAKESLRRAS